MPNERHENAKYDAQIAHEMYEHALKQLNHAKETLPESDPKIKGLRYRKIIARIAYKTCLKRLQTLESDDEK